MCVCAHWLLLKSGRNPPALNMAWDEALLEACASLAKPVLRFYGWSEPAASFGYFQRYTDMERLTSLRPLIRRPTGGGLVQHDRDWTYSLVIPVGHPWHRLHSRSTYARVHLWIKDSFAHFGLTTILADADQDGGGRCFAGAVRHDLLLVDRKIAGAAMRRTRNGLLVQGSVQAPSTINRAQWEAAMQTSASEVLGVAWSDLAPEKWLVASVEVLAAQKYSRSAYNQRR